MTRPRLPLPSWAIAIGAFVTTRAPTRSILKPALTTVWLTRKTVTPGFALTSLKIDLLAGCYGTGNSSPGTVKYDNVKLLSSVTGSFSLPVPNAGFETPVLDNGNWQYAPGGGAWSFAGGGGISAMNSAFT